MLKFYKSNPLIENSTELLNKRYGSKSDDSILMAESFFGTGDDIQTFNLSTIKQSEGLGQVLVDGIKLSDNQYSISTINNTITFNRQSGHIIPNEKNSQIDDPNIIISNNSNIENRLFYNNQFVQSSNSENDRVKFEKVWFKEENEYIYKNVYFNTNDFEENANEYTPISNMKFSFHIPEQMPLDETIYNPDPQNLTVNNIYNYDEFYDVASNKWFDISSGTWVDTQPLEETPPDIGSQKWVNTLYINKIPKNGIGYFWVKIEVPENQQVQNLTTLAIQIEQLQEDPNDMFS